MRNTSILVTALVVLFGLASWGQRPAPASAAEKDREATVRLYSGGEVVGEWRAVGPGWLEGESFVFPVERDFGEVEVRIQGTFSYEVRP